MSVVVPYTLTLPEILSGSAAAGLEITGLGSLPLATAIGVGTLGYNQYQKRASELNERAHYSDRNANRLIYNIGQPSRSGSRRGSVVIPEGYLGSQSNPVRLGGVLITPKSSAIQTRSLTNLDDTDPPAPDPTPDPTPEPAPDPAPATRDSAAGSGTTNPAPANPNPNDKKGFREKLKQVVKRLKLGYGNAIIGLEYALGTIPAIAAAGGAAYGVYRMANPEKPKTRPDSILEMLTLLAEELAKIMLISENLKRINNILKGIEDMSSSLIQQNDSNYYAPPGQIVESTDTFDF